MSNPLFSLGSVLYVMASGRAPFRATGMVAVLKRVAEDDPRPIREIIPETPQWLCDIIAKLHAKDPDERFQSAREVADVLADCEAQLKEHLKLKDYSRIPRGNARPSGRRKWVAVAAALLPPIVALAVTELAGVTQVFRGRQANHGPPKPNDEGAPVRAVAEEAPFAEEWVPLFNGKDLTGWTTPPKDAVNWGVQDGVIVGRGEGPTYLHSARDDYEDFHLRAEMKICAGSDSGIYFRCGSAPSVAIGGRPEVSPSGYEANACFSPGQAVGIPPYVTGSLWVAGQVLATPQESPAVPDQWFTLEVVARGNRIVIKVNGTTTVDYSDAGRLYRSGHLAIQAWSHTTVVHVRKIEIRENVGKNRRPGAPSPEAESPAAIAPFTDADVKRIAALPAAEQVEEVRKELVRRNPGFDGTVGHKIEDGVVTEIRVVTDKVTDISPLRVFNALRVLDCSGTEAPAWHGNGQLADLTPLKGMNLAGLKQLNLNWTQVGDAGLSCFQDCKNLTHLKLWGSQVGDAGMANFNDCKNLTGLWLGRTKVSNAGVVHFQNCNNLEDLGLPGTQVDDTGLVYFKDCKKLKGLDLTDTLVTHTGLACFKDFKDLMRIYLGGTKVTDLSPLKGMPLKALYGDFQPERDAEILRSIKTLETINGKPAAEFWRDVEQK